MISEFEIHLPKPRVLLLGTRKFTAGQKKNSFRALKIRNNS